MTIDHDDLKGLIGALQTAHDNASKMADHAVLMEKISNMASTLDEIKSSTKENSEKFVTKVEFKPVKMIVFGVVGLINLTVFGALLTLVVKSI